MSTRKTFCAFGAYAVNVIDPKATVLMPLINATDLSNPLNPSKFITVDLSQRLRDHVDLDKVVVDTLGIDGKGKPKKQERQEYSQLDGINVLTIGPEFPAPHVGSIYIDKDKFFKSVRPLLGGTTGWPQPGLRTYELMTTAVQRSDGSVIRYHGFHATVVEALDGARKVLGVELGNATINVTVDMNSRDYCDDPLLLVKEIVDPENKDSKVVLLDASSQRDKDGGAVFLELTFCATSSLRSPKEPIGGG